MIFINKTIILMFGNKKQKQNINKIINRLFYTSAIINGKSKNNNTTDNTIQNKDNKNTDNNPIKRKPGRPKKNNNPINTDNTTINTESKNNTKENINKSESNNNITNIEENIKHSKKSSPSSSSNEIFTTILNKIITEPENIQHNITEPIKGPKITEESIIELQKLLAEIENDAININTINATTKDNKDKNNNNSNNTINTTTKHNNNNNKIKARKSNKSNKLIKRGYNIESTIISVSPNIKDKNISSSDNNNKYYNINNIYTNNNTLDYYVKNTVSILPDTINFNNLYNIILNSLSKTIENITNNNNNNNITENNNNINNNIKPNIYQSHGWHLVTPSPWPVQISYVLILLPLSTVIYFNGYKVPFINSSIILVIINLILTIFIIFLWFRDIVIEGTYIGNHTILVQSSLTIGIILFILSEVIFFFSIFWAYFHSSLSPAIELGTQWPPIGIIAINAFELPLLNTILLLSSAATVTYSHHSLINKDKKPAINGILITLSLAIIFTICQSIEYYNAGFTFSDGVYGSTFYMATGFHGLHVIIGTIFLIVAFGRIIYNQITNTHHVGLEAAILYYHFVDIVWLALFVIVYWWGS